MYIDERLLKILETHKGETVEVNFIISLIKTIAEEYETEQLRIGEVSQQRELLKIIFEKHYKETGYIDLRIDEANAYLDNF